VDRDLLHWLIGAAATAAAALALLTGGFRVLLYVLRRRPTLTALGRRCRWPARVLAVCAALWSVVPVAPFSGPTRSAVAHVLALVFIAASARLALEVTFVMEDLALSRYRLDVRDNLRARKVRTQVVVLRRVTVVVVSFIAAVAMLMTFDRARALGTSLLASAGVIGLVAGVAAQSSLKNLIAGIQIAVTEPIRLDDVVVVEEQWGRVEEITLTYVVVKLWDNRRLVLPISYFVENAFENWTRQTSDLVGTVTLYLDHRTPVDALRGELLDVLRSSPRWNGEAWTLQVTDVTERTIEVRALMSADDAGTAFDLRCEVRERLVAWLQREHPESLPQLRTDVGHELAGATPSTSR
jgi:small-conductance mechanosensitive channel